MRAVIAYACDDGEPPEHANQVHTVRLATELAAALLENRPDAAEHLCGVPSALALNLYPEDVQGLVARGSTIASAVEVVVDDVPVLGGEAVTEWEALPLDLAARRVEPSADEGFLVVGEGVVIERLRV